MAKKVEKKKSSVSGKMLFGVVLAVGSAVAAYVASKFFSKKNELASSQSEKTSDDVNFEATEDNYITLDNEVVEEEAQASEVTEETLAEENASDETAETDGANEEVSDEEAAAEETEDDLTKCIQ